MFKKDIKVVTVIGANGTMGFNASAIFASFGNATVYMVSRGIQKSRNSVNLAVKAVRAEAIRLNLVPCDYSNIEECVGKSDLVFESVAEDIELKKEITELIGKYAKDTTIIATGTSGLSINEIASVLPRELKKNYYGMHFFNPPYSMPLLELVPSNYCDADATKWIKNYLENVLLRKVIVCKDKPAFIANRIGFQFMNMALQRAEEYKNEGGIDYIDAILGPFTGRTMAPCATVDFVGLDVHKAIVENLYINTADDKNDSFKLPGYINKLISEGNLGNKAGRGLFYSALNEDGSKIKYVFDIKANKYVLIRKYDVAFANIMSSLLKNGDYKEAFKHLKDDNSKEAKICKEFLKDYVEYSVFVGKEVGESLDSIDDAMATGFNWCPPLAMSNVLFDTNYSTKYDFRSFFKAVK